MQTNTAQAQTIRAKYRARVENDLVPYQLAALLMSRTPQQGRLAGELNCAAIDAATLIKIGKALASLAVAHGPRPV